MKPLTAIEARTISNACFIKESDVEFNEYVMLQVHLAASKGYTGVKIDIALGLKYKTKLEGMGYEVYHNAPFKTNDPIMCSEMVVSWAHIK